MVFEERLEMVIVLRPGKAREMALTDSPLSGRDGN
jgi:hypothetical protein